jgi:hypothetical protein
VFDKPRPTLNVRALIRDMLEDERDLITLLGLDFLAEYLADVETRLDRWQRYVANHYVDDMPPRGDAEKLRAYQIEYALIKQLAAESQTEPFPIVHQRALKQARQRVRRLVNQRNSKNFALSPVRFEARLEQELLIALWLKWHRWLRPRQLRHRSS